MADVKDFDYTEAFAEHGQRSSIEDAKYKGGWVDVVGGINGIPTAQQFNEIMNHQEEKVNALFGYADDNFKAMSRISEDEIDEMLEGEGTADELGRIQNHEIDEMFDGTYKE